jgi:2',3'-cyclic-nucleotide 2'-phosphodiesterase/3'-nucleotidase
MLPDRGWSRRRFLGTGAAYLGAGVMSSGEAGRRVRTVSLLHTTDLHGHIRPTRTYDGIGGVGGLARCATCIRQWRRANPDSLLLDVGDVYQGTKVGLDTGGEVMIRLFNQLGYDGWVIGNHDFDWGRELLEKALAASNMDVLTGNLTVDGKPVTPGGLVGAWKKVTPWTVKEVAGFRIGLVGLTTPGLHAWLPPELLAGIAAADPVESLRRSVAALKAERTDAIVVLGHMGWKSHDDFANPVREVLGAVEGVDVFLAGHSHQDKAAWMAGDVLCSQASYYGIHCGRVDLSFDVDSRKLIDRRAFTVLMDGRYEPDPAVLKAAGDDLRASDESMARVLTQLPAAIPGGGRGSELVEHLCGAFAWALGRAGHQVDGVFHGSFGTREIAAGPVTVADCWELIPYENRLLVAELARDELAAIVEEDASERFSDRTLWPFEVKFGPGGKLKEMLFRGEPVDAERRFRIALNAYDGQGAGRRLPRLAEVVAAPQAKRQLTRLDSRGALIDYLVEGPKRD